MATVTGSVFKRMIKLFENPENHTDNEVTLMLMSDISNRATYATEHDGSIVGFVQEFENYRIKTVGSDLYSHIYKGSMNTIDGAFMRFQTVDMAFANTPDHFHEDKYDSVFKGFVRKTVILPYNQVQDVQAATCNKL